MVIKCRKRQGLALARQDLGNSYGAIVYSESLLFKNKSLPTQARSQTFYFTIYILVSYRLLICKQKSSFKLYFDR